MGQSDILTYAYGSFFVGIFVSVMLTLAAGGGALLSYDDATLSFNQVSGLFSTKSESATISGWIDNVVKSSENPLAFDIILGIINVGLFVFKIVDFFLITLFNYFTLSIWLVSSGAPGAITGMLVMSWQFWTFWHFAKFVFKGERVGN